DAVVPARLAGATVLVVDVLRASTTIIAALAAGCAGVTPVADPVEARRRAAADGALLAGERRGEPIAGFDLGNSPLEFTRGRAGARAQGRREPGRSRGARRGTALRPRGDAARRRLAVGQEARGGGPRRGRDRVPGARHDVMRAAVSAER